MAGSCSRPANGTDKRQRERVTMYGEQERITPIPGRYDYELPDTGFELQGIEWPADTVIYSTPEWGRTVILSGYYLVTAEDTTISGGTLVPRSVSLDDFGIQYHMSSVFDRTTLLEERLIKPWQGPAPDPRTIPTNDSENE